MEIKQITKEMYEDLKKPLPIEAIKPHPTKSFLSSIKAIYVTERLNDVFGCGKWQLKVNHIITSEKSMVVVKAILEIPEYGVYYESFGGNDNGGENSKNFDLGDAFKGATTDAITKICSYLGIGIDVFKGLSNTSNTINTNTKKELNWLNILDKNKNYTREWENVLKGIRENKITNINDVKKYFKISKEVEEKINELLNKK